MTKSLTLSEDYIHFCSRSRSVVHWILESDDDEKQLITEPVFVVAAIQSLILKGNDLIFERKSFFDKV